MGSRNIHFPCAPAFPAKTPAGTSTAPGSLAGAVKTDSLNSICFRLGSKLFARAGVPTGRCYEHGKSRHFGGKEVMEPTVNSQVRELCKSISEEESLERMESLLDELLRLLDERQLLMSLM